MRARTPLPPWSRHARCASRAAGRTGGTAHTALGALLACAGVFASGCSRPGAELVADWHAARARAEALGTWLVVHFRLPGRPLSDAMDAALAAANLRAAAPDLVHVRVDATREHALFVRLCGGSARRGPGLATCVVDPAAGGQPLAVQLGYLAASDLERVLADAAALRSALGERVADRRAGVRKDLDVGDHLVRCGRRAEARARYAATFASGGRPAQESAARLARLCIEDGDVVRATEWLAHAPNGAHATLTRAMVHLQMREPRAALALLQSLAPRDDVGEDAPTVLLQLGRAWHETGDDQAALATFARLRETFPGSPVADQAARESEHVGANGHGHDHGETPTVPSELAAPTSQTGSAAAPPRTNTITATGSDP